MKEYLDLVKDVLDNGSLEDNRTGTSTLSKFGCFYKVDLSKGYPLLTTKFVSFKNVFRELLWYLSGDKHIRGLQEHTKIWDGWADEQGRLETAYGRYWRRFPANLTCEITERVAEKKNILNTGEVIVNYAHKCLNVDDHSFDQIKYVIETLKEIKINPATPNRRRMIVSAWYPGNAVVSKLPPCHYTFAFNVTGNKLNCHLTQRSGDIGLGIPYNLACYSLLTSIIAHITGYEVGEFAHTIIDAHIYTNHIEQLKEQLTREPGELPELIFNREIKCIDDLKFEDIEVVGYECDPAIKMEVSI